jgi:hypothetical protein
MVEAMQGNQSVLMAFVVATYGVPAGWITFLDGGAVLGTAETDPEGVASLAVPPLTTGTHSLFAAFATGSRFAPSVSPMFIAQIPGAREAFALSLSSHSIDLTSPEMQSILITVSPLADFSGNIQLDCRGGVPSGYRCAFSPAILSTGVSQLRIERLSKSSNLQARLYFIICPTGIFSMVLFGTLRRRRRAVMLMLLASGVVCLISCGTPSTPRAQKEISVLSIQASAGTGINAAVQSAELVVVSDAN